MTMSPARTDWSAVIAGAILATAIALVLVAFGVALGLSVTSPFEGESASAALFATGAGLWFLWIQLMSFSCGGYVAGRLRRRRADESEHEADVRDGLHGLLVWAVGVLAAAAISLGGMTAGTAASRQAPALEAARAVGDEVAQSAEAAAADATAQNPEAADETLAERQAEAARKLAVLAAFATAAAMLAGAAAAFFAAHAGGNHRDRNTVLPFFSRTSAQAPKTTLPKA